MPSNITAVVPTSPIAAHPDTVLLETTLSSIRHHLPTAEIILCFDGVRAEQAHLSNDYAEYTRRALWLADKKYGNVLPLIFDEHMHQTGMMRAALKEIRTTQLLFVEHDAPLVTDEPIHWNFITMFIESGKSHLVRFHHESHILPAHKHLMHGRENVLYERTSQYSARPHLASVDYYKHVMATYFTPQAKSFLEDRLYGVVDEAFNIHGMAGLDEHRLHIYAPDGNIKRSYHTDGRAGGPKWDDSQVF